MPSKLLTAGHRVDDFACGSEGTTNWLRRRAVAIPAGGSGRVYVVRRLRDDQIVGFHMLATGTILPLDSARGAGAANDEADDADGAISVIILARLGVDGSEQGRGLGRALLVDALSRASAAADIVGVRAVLAHAPDARSRAFYLAQAEFEPSPTDPLHLAVMIKDLRRSAR